MPIQPRDLMDVAQAIFIDHKADEKYIRTSISRAYYCAYHTCEPISETLPKVEYPPNFRPGSHQEVIDKLKECPRDGVHASHSKCLRTVGRALQAAFDNRISADYRLKDSIVPQDGNTQLLRVARLLWELEHAGILEKSA